MSRLLYFIKWFFVDVESKYDEFIDSKLLFSVFILITIGTIMVYSSSIAYSTNLGYPSYHFFIRHIVSLIIGGVVGFITFSIPTTLIRKHAFYISIFILILLMLVLMPHIGKVVNGSRRWIGFASLGFQPSEFSKLGIVIFLSYFLANRVNGLTNFKKDYMPLLLFLVLFIALPLLEPDMGTATVVFMLALTILYVSEAISNKFMMVMIATGVVGFVLLMVLEPYRMRRFLGFMDPWQDALGKGYQLTHSLLAIGHGGWFGVGLGNSVEKLFYLPEAHTDFILAIITEELGIISVLGIILLFCIIFYRGFVKIGLGSKYMPQRKFQSLVAQGISVWFLIQAFINIGVTIGLLPTKGLTLPFISYGGSSILVNFISIAILLRIDYENKIILRGGVF
jgi:cell division protein FtsW